MTLAKARLSTALAEIAASPLPPEIQWMPPGTHTITPLVNGAAKTVTVHADAAAADRVRNAVQQWRKAAAAGIGDMPFLDFNHEDREASARVVDVTWGGSDPKRGGIRAKIQWTAAGRDALSGGMYRRFSPEFSFAESSGHIYPADVNMGGLVNKAAFTTIQSVVAKASNPAALVGLVHNPFMDRVREVMQESGCTEPVAWTLVREQNPELFKHQLLALTGMTEATVEQLGLSAYFEQAATGFVTPQNAQAWADITTKTARALGNVGPEAHPFVSQARALADSDKIDFVDATARIAAKQPALYAAYLNCCRGR
ncbi:MAG TPA: phage protease [Candidatus Acidoferrum sp.]|nr:phage protease [Candidatus Acidoferrum sp.]